MSSPKYSTCKPSGDFDKLGRGYVWSRQIDPLITQNLDSAPLTEPYVPICLPLLFYGTQMT